MWTDVSSAKPRLRCGAIRPRTCDDPAGRAACGDVVPSRSDPKGDPLSQEEDGTSDLGDVAEERIDLALRGSPPPDLPADDWLRILSDAADIIASGGGEHLDSLVPDPQVGASENDGGQVATAWEDPDEEAFVSSSPVDEGDTFGEEDPDPEPSWSEPDPFDEGAF